MKTSIRHDETVGYVFFEEFEQHFRVVEQTPKIFDEYGRGKYSIIPMCRADKLEDGSVGQFISNREWFS